MNTRYPSLRREKIERSVKQTHELPEDLFSHMWWSGRAKSSCPLHTVLDWLLELSYLFHDGGSFGEMAQGHFRLKVRVWISYKFHLRQHRSGYYLYTTLWCKTVQRYGLYTAGHVWLQATTCSKHTQEHTPTRTPSTSRAGSVRGTATPRRNQGQSPPRSMVSDRQS